MAWKRDVYTDHDACGVGFIAQAGSTGSREVVERALVALGRLSHRGGVDADGTSGDGAGLLTAIPQDFIRERARKEGIELPREFGLGMVFLPRGRTEQACAAIEDSAEKAGLRFLGWRDVPVNAASLGPRAEATVPVIRQCFVAAGGGWAERFLPVRPGSPIAEGWDDDTATSFNSSGLAALTPEHDWNVRASFERRLFLWRKRTESEAPAGTYFCSLSSRTMVYKGLLTPAQLAGFYPDLASEDFVSPFAVFHQRYSTNTQPSWKLAQPFRLVGHNGEINTLSANRRWMRARGAALREEFGAGEWFQALEEGVSDSASFDNALEIHLRRGFNLAEAMLRMVPAAWENNRQLDARVRDYLEGAAREQEPWDGPAALVFSDGRFVGAKLDRNGLRPLRYTLTADGLIVLGSEVGIADLHAERVIERQRLGPGEMLLVDLVEGTVYRNGEISKLLAKAGARSVSGRAVRLKPTAGTVTGAGRTAEPKRTAAALGWTEDQFRLLFEPLGAEGKEATWSMGDDGPPAFLSAARRPLWDYCKQRFAQVTNPPIDPLREQHVMSLEVHLGAGVVMDSPVVDAWQMVELEGGLLQPAARIDITFAAEGEVEAALEALARVEREAAAVTRGKPAMVVLSDRGVSAERAALPALLATAAVWKGMVLSLIHI